MAKRRIRLYGTGDPLDYVPFNIDNRPRNKRTRAIFEELGYETWRDVWSDWDIVKSGTVDNYRHNAYNTPDELIRRYQIPFEMGLVRILYNYHTGMYHAYVMDSGARS